MRVSHIGKKSVIIKTWTSAVAVFTSLKNENYFVNGFFIFIYGKEN